MIRSFYGLTQNPFDLRALELLPQQRDIHDTTLPRNCDPKRRHSAAASSG
jgi:hypothetical protein